MSKKASSSWIFLLAGVVVLLLIGLAFSKNRAPGQYDALAQCLSDKGTKVYSAFWCPNCAKQKELFGNSYRLLNDKECAIRGADRNLTLCKDDGITGVPTWEFNDGSRLTGVQSLSTLADRAGCRVDGASNESSVIIEGEGSSSVVPVTNDSGTIVDVTSDSGVSIKDISVTPVKE